jgi:hypothetical protein
MTKKTLEFFFDQQEIGLVVLPRVKVGALSEDDIEFLENCVAF